MTSAELLKEDIATSQRGLVDMIELSGKNLNNVINGLLDLSRWEAESIQVNRELFDPLELQQNIADTFAFSQTADLSIILDADPDLAGTSVVADQSIVRQIMLNIMTNAVKFTTKGHVTLLFKLRRGSQPYIDCYVTDTGVGMTPEFVKEGLFRPFKKANEFTQGLGLSLAVSKHLADSTHSSLQVLSTEPGKGTDMMYSFPIALETQVSCSQSLLQEQVVKLVLKTDYNMSARSVSVNAARRLLTTILNVSEQDVTNPSNQVRLVDYDQELPDDGELTKCTIKTILLCQPDVIPIISDEVASLAHVVIITKPIGVPKLRTALEQLATKQLEHNKKTEFQQTRVLIVDDNAVNRNMLAMYCRKRKLYFETACDGQEACDKFRDGVFSVVLMDCQMPQMDGLTASKMIRRCERDRNCNHSCLIIILTGLSIHELKDSSQEVGADRVCGKPISLKTLDALLSVA